MSNNEYIIVSDHYAPEIRGGAELVAESQAKILRILNKNITVLSTVNTWQNNSLADVVINRQEKNSQEKAIFVLRAISIKNSRLGKQNLFLVHNIRYIGHEIFIVLKNLGSLNIWLHDFFLLCEIGTGLRASGGSLCFESDRCRCINNDIEEFFIRESKIYSLSHAHQIFSPSKYLADIFMGAIKQKIDHMSNKGAIDLNSSIEVEHASYCSIPEPHLKMLWTGYHGWHKGVIDAVEIIDRLPKDGDWCFTILGSGTDTHKFENLQKTCQPNQIHILGQVTSEIALSHIKETHILIHPSIWPENEPLSIIAAKEFGKWVAAYNFGGTQELLSEYHFAISAPVNDIPTLHQKIQDLYFSKNWISQETLKPEVGYLGFQKWLENPTIEAFEHKVRAIWITGDASKWPEHHFGEHFNWRLFRPSEIHKEFDLENFRALVIAGPNFDHSLLRLAITKGRVIFAPASMPNTIVPNIRYLTYKNLDHLAWLIERNVSEIRVNTNSYKEFPKQSLELGRDPK